jgi:hypothetical protein
MWATRARYDKVTATEILLFTILYRDEGYQTLELNSGYKPETSLLYSNVFFYIRNRYHKYQPRSSENWLIFMRVRVLEGKRIYNLVPERQSGEVCGYISCKSCKSIIQGVP